MTGNRSDGRNDATRTGAWRQSRRCTVLAVLGVLVWVLPAAAFERTERFCDAHRTHLTYHFSGAGWTVARVTDFRRGVADWTAMRDFAGNAMFTATETTGSGVPVRVVEGNSVAMCNSSTGAHDHIGIDSTASTVNFDAEGHSSFHSHSTHEVGHVYGYVHTGAFEAFFGGETTMGGCFVASDQASARLSSDDDAAVQYHLTPFSDTPVTANPSFEYGFTSSSSPWHFWQPAEGTTLTHVSGGVYGATYGRIYWSATESLGQARALSRLNIPSSGVTASIYARTSATGVGGTTIYLQTRPVSYPAGCAGQWESGTHDYVRHSPQPGVWVTRESEGCVLSGSWQLCDTDSYHTHSTPAMDVRLYINSNRQTAGGAPIPVDIDYAGVVATHP